MVGGDPGQNLCMHMVSNEDMNATMSGLLLEAHLSCRSIFSISKWLVLMAATFWFLITAVLVQLLYDTFSAFGMIVATPKIMRDPETGLSRGFGFVSYDSFEASDSAIEAMHGQFLCNRWGLLPYACLPPAKLLDCTLLYMDIQA